MLYHFRATRSLTSVILSRFCFWCTPESLHAAKKYCFILPLPWSLIFQFSCLCLGCPGISRKEHEYILISIRTVWKRRAPSDLRSLLLISGVCCSRKANTSTEVLLNSKPFKKFHQPFVFKLHSSRGAPFSESRLMQVLRTG